jgi:pSer/pThr/pTyr-binding forkhead associated (FHA) protein
VFTLDKGNLFIGRDLGNDIVINDAEISRRHARLVMQSDSFVIEDLGSTNGTSVNGQKLSGACLLHAGDAITFGEKVKLDFELVLTNPDATVLAPRSAQVLFAPQAPVQPRPQPISQPVMAPPPQPIRHAPVPPPPSYSGYVPANPAPEPAAPHKKKFPIWIIIVILVVLLMVCVCAGAAWYIDQNFLWCKVLPFLPGCS